MIKSPLKIGLIGMGLIGGSFALALKKARADQVHFIGYARRKETGQRALELGILDELATDLHALAAKADVIMLAVPMLAMPSLLLELAPVLPKKTILSDVGSVKGSVVEAALAAKIPLEQFVLGHPIAGTEQSGVEAGFATLFVNRKVVLTPLPQTDKTALALVEALWRDCGATVDHLEVSQHDRVLAATSHLPHMLAFALVDTLMARESEGQVFRYAAGGFKDFSRIASSDATMWRDIALANDGAIVEAIDDLSKHLQSLKQLIENADERGIYQLFNTARERRNSWLGEFTGTNKND